MWPKFGLSDWKTYASSTYLLSVDEFYRQPPPDFAPRSLPQKYDRHERNLGNLKAPLMKDRTHSHRLRSGPLLALGSAFLFGASTPIAKLLLGVTDLLLLAGLLYRGSGSGLARTMAV